MGDRVRGSGLSQLFKLSIISRGCAKLPKFFTYGTPDPVAGLSLGPGTERPPLYCTYSMYVSVRSAGQFDKPRGAGTSKTRGHPLGSGKRVQKELLLQFMLVGSEYKLMHKDRNLCSCNDSFVRGLCKTIRKK